MATTRESVDMYPEHRVPTTRPFIWLSEGWDSLLHHPAASLAYGVIVALLGSLILAYDQHPLYIALAISAFLVVGPVITAGLCELSRCRDHGDAYEPQGGGEGPAGHGRLGCAYPGPGRRGVRHQAVGDGHCAAPAGARDLVCLPGTCRRGLRAPRRGGAQPGRVQPLSFIIALKARVANLP